MRRMFPIILVAALFAALSIAPTGAEELDASFRLTEAGSFTIGTFPESLTVPVGGTGIEGVYDDATGDFEGQFTIGSIPPLEISVGMITAVANVALVGGPVTGTFDESTGEVDLHTSLTFDINIVEPIQAVCAIPNIHLTLTTFGAGGSPFDPADPIDQWVFTLADDSFTVPVATGEALCDAVTAALELPATSGNSMVLAMESGTIPPDVPVPPAVPTVPGGAAPVADAVAEGPRFTG